MVGQESLFTLGPNNAVVRMLGASGPRVLTYQVDSKKELEKGLKVGKGAREPVKRVACMSVWKHLGGPGP